MLRRFTTAVMGLFALGMLVAPVEAAELEGFGPIKFGMSKEEAFEAIERRGEWVGSDILRYILPIEVQRKKESVQVLQTFANGEASDVVAKYSDSWPPLYCLSKSLYFVGEIKRKYGTEPLISHGVLREVERSDDKPQHVIEDMYVFMFSAGASINLRFTSQYGEGGCRIVITYRAPLDLENPF